MPEKEFQTRDTKPITKHPQISSNISTLEQLNTMTSEQLIKTESRNGKIRERATATADYYNTSGAER